MTKIRVLVQRIISDDLDPDTETIVDITVQTDNLMANILREIANELSPPPKLPKFPIHRGVQDV